MTPLLRRLRMTAVTALRALRRHAMRSALTILGIVIGVAAVITVVGIGQGASRAIQNEIASMGNNLLMVYPGTRRGRGGAHSGWGGASTLTKQDAAAIAEEASTVQAVSYSSGRGVQVLYGNANWSTSAQATTPEYQIVGNADVARGEFFTERDLDAAARVAVIGQTVVDQLFEAGEDPLGAVIRVEGITFRVIGVLESKGGAQFGGDRDDVVLVPFTAAERRLFGSRIPGSVQRILVSAREGVSATAAALEIEQILRDRHRLPVVAENDFGISSQEEVARTLEIVTGVLSSVLSGVASISLLVGGIGIMNILLVSVTERTREIGIRMAVGAKRRDILIQFLVESVLLSLLGGVLGTCVGIAGTFGISRVADFPFVFSPLVVVGAVLFSATVGIFFGFYPARQAARLDPIASLRYE